MTSAIDHKRYQSTVVHLPQHMVDSPSGLLDDELDGYLSLKQNAASNTPRSSNTKPVVHAANAKSIVVVDELANFLTFDEAPHPTIPCTQRISAQHQTHAIWSMIALFFISMLICTMLLAQNSITALYIIEIVCALSGLLLAYFYNANMHFTYSLSNKIDDLLSQQKQLKLETEALEEKLQKEQKQHENDRKEEEIEHAVVPLLDSFRNGDFHKELAYCACGDIKQLLPVIAHTLCELPFGLTQFRSNLFVILANRISTDPSLDQAWRFFLHSYGDIPSIKRIWGSHEYCLKDVKEVRVDSVQWFKSLFDDLEEINATKSIDSSQFVCDPINGNILVKVELIALPYRINCYTLNEEWSSTMILKRDQDLRKDLGIILMFKYFNQIWRENRNMCNGAACEAITFEVIPMGIDFGCVEWIHNAFDIKDDAVDTNLNINKLIATAAGCCVALFVCGVTYQENIDTIGIRKDGALFHVDFCHIFGEKDNDLNASVAISNRMRTLLDQNQLDQLVEVVRQCFSSLRKDYIHILDYSRVVFGYMQHSDNNEKYLKESLFIDTTEEKDALANAVKAIFNKNGI